MKRLNKSILSVCLIASMTWVSSCSKATDEPLRGKVQYEEEAQGEEVKLDLTATLTESSLRSVVYDYTNELLVRNNKGRTPRLKLPETVPVRVCIRKVGNNSVYEESLASVVLNGKVTDKGGEYSVRMLGSVKLRKAEHSLKQGKWEVLCVIGGKSNIKLPQNDQEDQNNQGRNETDWSNSGHFVYAGKNSYSTSSVAETEGTSILTGMPWMTDWVPLTTYPTGEPTDGHGQNLKLVFKPKGILLRVKPRSNMIFDLKLQKLVIYQGNGTKYLGAGENPPLSFQGIFQMTANAPEPKYVRQQNEPTTITLEDEPLLKAGEELDRTIYLWAMPNPSFKGKAYFKIELHTYQTESRSENIFENRRLAEIYKGLGYIPSGKEGNSKNEKHRWPSTYTTVQTLDGFEHGHTYTFHPILTSELIISEIFMRTDVPATNAYNNSVNANPTSTWGGIEIYNPTLSPISLSDYGVFRLKGMKVHHEIDDFEAHTMGSGIRDENKAIVQPLNFSDGAPSYTFEGTEATGYTNKKREVYGRYPENFKLESGKTAVLLDASYVRHAQTTPERIHVNRVGSMGIQIKQAFDRQYCQVVVALDNGKNKVGNDVNFRSPEAPVLCGGTQDIYVLVKKKPNSHAYEYIDRGGARPWEVENKTYWSGTRYSLQSARHGRDGNTRTRFTPVVAPVPGVGNDNYDQWGFAPSWEKQSLSQIPNPDYVDKGGDSQNTKTRRETEAALDGQEGDYINKFCTLGSRVWLGPTEKSREGEWNAVPNFTPPAKRKWKVDKKP